MSSTGVIKGKATTAGTYDFTVQVVNTNSKTYPPKQNTATSNLSNTIGQSPHHGIDWSSRQLLTNRE